MDRLLKRIQRVRPAVFCSLDYFLLHDNAPAYKAASVCPFLKPKKCYNTLSPPPSYSSDVSPPDYFLFPKSKMKLKGLHLADVAEIQEAVIDKLKEGPKRGIFGSFSESVRPYKSLYICKWSLF